ncbi:MAG: protein NO VEIN domain-containing protein [Prosthecobacter sp.]
MIISPSRFRAAFNRFQAIHVDQSGWPLDSFSNRDSFAFQWEGYKNAIPDRAMAIMEPQRWSEKQIGSGTILKSVIQGIELPGNNLLHWEGRQGPDSRVHLALINAQEEVEERRALEKLFHQLYTLGHANKTIFEAIVARCGRRYELLGYLFFLAAPDRFLPLRTRSFDKALTELGVDLRTESSCGWENYLSFLSAIREVRRCLQAEGMSDATLLDAHSFCWILSRHAPGEGSRASEMPAVIHPFTGTLRAAPQGGEFTPKEDAAIRDMQEEAQRRQASGAVAEEIALKAEKERLCLEGRADLAAAVESVADRPGLGFDIKSFDKDGSDRFIEVKNVSNGHQFFLSQGEWLNSQARPNYWFYLVSDVDAAHAHVSVMSAKSLKQEHLSPVQYIVRFGV